MAARHIIGSMATLAVATMGAPAMAEDRTLVTRTLDTLEECRKIAPDQERLACFDRAAAAIGSARGKGELIVLDRAKVVERRRAQFGLGSPVDAGIGGAEVKQIDTKIRSASQSSRSGRWQLELVNGQVWETTEPIRFPPKTGDAIRISAGLLGAYNADLRRDSTKVKRIR